METTRNENSRIYNLINGAKIWYQMLWTSWLQLIFLVLTCESDSCILQFLNKLNLTYQRLTDFMASFYFIPIVLVLWSRFPLCYTPIRPFLTFRDQNSILIVGCVTTLITRFASPTLHQPLFGRGLSHPMLS